MCVRSAPEDGILITLGLRPPEPVRFAPAERFTINAPAAVQQNPEHMPQARRIAGVQGVIFDTAVPGIPTVQPKDNTFGMDITTFFVRGAMQLIPSLNGVVCTVTSVP